MSTPLSSTEGEGGGEEVVASLQPLGSWKGCCPDGRSINLTEVILRHGGEASAAAQAFDGLSDQNRCALLEFLQSLVLFPPDDTSSNLNPGDRTNPGWPQIGHGSIKLSVLFNDSNDPE